MIGEGRTTGGAEREEWGGKAGTRKGMGGRGGGVKRKWNSAMVVGGYRRPWLLAPNPTGTLPLHPLRDFN